MSRDHTIVAANGISLRDCQIKSVQIILGNGNVLPNNNHPDKKGITPGLRWEACNSAGRIPPDAILGGRDIDFDLIYVGRSCHNDEVLPAKIIPTHHKLYAFVCYGGDEIRKDLFEVLCGDPSSVSWMQATNGSVPQRALVGGMTSDGEKLYIGRAKHLTSLTVGKVHPSHGRLYIPFNGDEFCTTSYEVLCET